MKCNSMKCAFFSPTGTTKTVLQGIADGFAPESREFIDITKPEARKQPLRVSKEDLLVVGVPVYMGRVPALLQEWLQAVQADNTPTVCVVVYGNRAFENSLLELGDTLRSRGCVPVAAGAFIGEHSFADSQRPVALGRPDAQDMAFAMEFGGKIREKLESGATLAQIGEVVIPGEHPYAGRTQLWDVDFIAVNGDCVQCGLCAEVCPVDAVDPEDSSKIDIQRCITCCACIKACPQSARSKKQGPVDDAANRLNTLHGDRKSPEYFV